MLLNYFCEFFKIFTKIPKKFEKSHFYDFVIEYDTNSVYFFNICDHNIFSIFQDFFDFYVSNLIWKFLKNQ